MNKILNKYSLMVSAGALLINLCSCKHEAAEEGQQPFQLSDSLMRTLVVDTVKTSNVTDALKFNGIVDFNTDKVANIFPLVSGTVQNVRVMPGDYVHAGQALGDVKSGEMANYTNSLEQAEANVRLTQRQLQQQKDLFSSGLASQVDVTSAQSNYEQAVAALTAARRILSINGNSTNGQYVIKSPVEGFVVQKNVTNGMAIRTDNSSPMFVVSDLKNVWVEANVYEENIGKLHEGQEADVTTLAYPDKVFKGHINKLMNILDPNTKVMKMRIVLDNPGYELKPQMFATVAVNTVENQQAISVSSSDLVFDHSQYYVIVLTGGKHVQLRPVDVISINGKTAYIKNGVNPGERLVGSDAILIYGSLNS
jgi:membrane fusion protein, heavy metal efflux system